MVYNGPVRLNGGETKARLAAVDREALVHNEVPFALSYWPSGKGEEPRAGPVLKDKSIQVIAFKRAEDGKDLIVRLFEPTGQRRKTTLLLECTGVEEAIQMAPFEIKTLRVKRPSGRCREVDLLER
jgi:alpha-mannosidase